MNAVDVITIEPYSDRDLPLLEQLLGDPEMMEHLGGPESPEKIRQRHQRYLQLPETDHMFTIVLNGNERVGNIGYWKKHWRGQDVLETGWHILSTYQGRGRATKAGELVIELARAEQRYPFMHAFPSIDNPSSNAICRKLGFTLLEECQFEYPPGNVITVNDWQLPLVEKFDK
jgi:RimJ/RimL family protein N-acetyltransferase